MTEQSELFDTLFNEPNLEPLREAKRQQIKESFTIPTKQMIDLAKRHVLGETLTDNETIFHESAMYYDPKRDAPSVSLMSLSEWSAANA